MSYAGVAARCSACCSAPCMQRRKRYRTTTCGTSRIARACAPHHACTDVMSGEPDVHRSRAQVTFNGEGTSRRSHFPRKTSNHKDMSCVHGGPPDYDGVWQQQSILRKAANAHRGREQRTEKTLREAPVELKHKALCGLPKNALGREVSTVSTLVTLTTTCKGSSAMAQPSLHRE
jgi:hypothetical protein